jgi:hypothetical protein
MHVHWRKLPWDAKAPGGKGGLYRSAKPKPVFVTGLTYDPQPKFLDSGRLDHHLGMTRMSKMYKSMEDMGYDCGRDSS